LKIDFFKTYFEKLQFIDKTGLSAFCLRLIGFLPAALQL
jgi:hypothetical protein